MCTVWRVWKNRCKCNYSYVGWKPQITLRNKCQLPLETGKLHHTILRNLITSLSANKKCIKYQTSNFKCAENQNINEKMTSVKVTIPNRPENIVNIKLLIYDTFIVNDKFYFNSLWLFLILFSLVLYSASMINCMYMHLELLYSKNKTKTKTTKWATIKAPAYKTFCLLI